MKEETLDGEMGERVVIKRCGVVGVKDVKKFKVVSLTKWKRRVAYDRGKERVVEGGLGV